MASLKPRSGVLQFDIHTSNAPWGWGPAISVSTDGVEPKPSDAKVVEPPKGGPGLCPVGGLGKYPFEVTLKPERFGRVCDFTYLTAQRALREGRAVEEEEFQFVDSRQIVRQPNRMGRFRRPMQRQPGGFMEKRQQQQDAERQQAAAASRGGKFAGGRGGRGGQQNALRGRGNWRGGNMGRGGAWNRWPNRNRALAEWSVEPTPEWQVVQEISLTQLPKQIIDASKIEVKDLFWRGELRQCNKTLDQVNPKMPVPLQSGASQKNAFYWVTTSDDSELTQLLRNEGDAKVEVAATDQVLSVLMSAVQSKQSWHLKLTKLEGRLLIDKIDGSSVDLLSVNETAREPPLPDDAVKANRPAELGVEALKINQDFGQQVLSDEAEVYEPPSFLDPTGQPPASKAYRYRTITLPGRNTGSERARKPIRIATRAEVDARVGPDAKDGYAAVRALHEFHDPKASGKSWKMQLESNQKGALLSQEVRNNNCKLARWVCQALIAGCDVLKMGFVSRVAPSDNQRHVILSVQSYRTELLAQQIGVKLQSAWGAVRAIIDSVMEDPHDGHYVLLRDPLKQLLRLYRVPEEGDVQAADGEEEEEEPIAVVAK